MSSSPAEYFMDSEATDEDPFFNVHDCQVYGSTPIPASWDGKEGDFAMVSYWWEDPPSYDEPSDVGIGIALVVGEDIHSVGFTPTEARKVAARLLLAANTVDPIEE